MLSSPFVPTAGVPMGKPTVDCESGHVAVDAVRIRDDVMDLDPYRVGPAVPDPCVVRRKVPWDVAPKSTGRSRSGAALEIYQDFSAENVT
jgi:hypothetical protein